MTHILTDKYGDTAHERVVDDLHTEFTVPFQDWVKCSKALAEFAMRDNLIASDSVSYRLVKKCAMIQDGKCNLVLLGRKINV